MKTNENRIVNLHPAYHRIITLVLVIQLVLLTNSGQAQKAYQSFNVDRDAPWQDERQFREELVQMRDRTAKHFRNSTGTNTAFLTAGNSLHYFENGAWQDIDNTIVSYQSVHFPYAVTKNQFHVFYGNGAAEGVKIQLLSEEFVFKGDFTLGSIINGEEETLAQSISFQPSSPEGESISYNQVFSGVNLTAKQMADSWKYDFVIQNNQVFGESNPQEQAFFIRQRIILPEGAQLNTNLGSLETGNEGKIASIEILNNGGSELIKLEMPYYHDAGESANGIFGWYDYTLSGNELTISTVIPASWARSSDRVYPLTIDPLVSIYPDLTTNWSGSVRNTGAYNENASGAFTGRSATSGYWHYWAKFNNSSIPDGATVNSVTGNFYRQVSFAYPVAVCRLDFDPPALTGLNVFNGIVAASGVYITSVSYAAGNAWTTHALGATAASDFAASLGNDYYSIGLRTLTTATGNVGRVHSHNQTNKPYLSVDYTPGGPPTTPACFQTVSSGNWEDASTWESRDNCTGLWIPATEIPGANSLGVIIQPGHNVTINTSVSCSLMTVQSNATLIVATGGTLVVSNGAGTDLEVIGTLQNTGGAISTSGGALINVLGIYDHARDGGALPTATWQITSDCKISGMTATTPSNLAQSFGNLTWQSPAQTGNAVLTGTNNPVNVQGVFLYASTGGGILDMSNINRNWTGDLYAGAVIALMRGTASGTSTLTINNLTINDTYTALGRVLLNNSTSTATITVTLNVLGNVLINPVSNVNVIGMNTFGSANLPISLIDVRGNWTQSNGFSSSAASQSQAVIRFTGAGVKSFTRTGGSFNNINFSVFSPAILDMGNSVLNNVGNFTLTSGAGLRIGSQDGISVSGATGAIQNSVGTRNFTSNGSYIYYNAYGAGTQSTGTGLPLTVTNLSNENSSGLSLTNASVTVTGVLDNSGLFILDDTKALIQGTSSSLTGSGNYRILRQGAASAQTYNYWSSPLVSATNSVLGGSGVYQYNPTLGTITTTDDTFDPGWVAVSGALIPGKGYTALGAGMVTFNGSINNAPTSNPVSYPVVMGGNNVGFNLVGNPFPSAIDGATFLNDNSSVLDGTLWLWDQSGQAPFISSDYATINSLGATSGGGNQTPTGAIASAQGFFVNKTSIGTDPIEFRNSQRTASGNAQFFQTEEISRFWLSVESPQNQYNELLVGFKSDATDGFDHRYDGRKLSGNNSLSFYSKLDDEALAIQGFSNENVARIVQLGLETSEPGTHIIRLKSKENMSGNQLIFLEDTYLNQVYSLDQSPSLAVEIQNNSLSERFRLHLQPALKIETMNATCFGNDGKVFINNNGTALWQYSLVDLQDNELSSGAGTQGLNELQGLTEGIYTLNISYDWGYSYSQVISINADNAPYADIQVSADTVPLEEAILEFQASGSTEWSYSWDFGDGSQEITGQDVIHPYMEAGIYTVTLHVHYLTCSATSTQTVSVTRDQTTTGNEELVNKSGIIFPNPANDQARLLLNTPFESVADLNIYDSCGRLVQHRQCAAGRSFVDIETSTFESGVYYIHLSGNGSTRRILLSIVH